MSFHSLPNYYVVLEYCILVLNMLAPKYVIIKDTLLNIQSKYCLHVYLNNKKHPEMQTVFSISNESEL